MNGAIELQVTFKVYQAIILPYSGYREGFGWYRIFVVFNETK
jgi:hypothetical protein